MLCDWTSWIACFEKGQTEYSDKHPSSQQKTPITKVFLRSVDKITWNNQRITTRMPTPETSVFKWSMKNIIHGWWYWKVCTCWVPQGLTNYLKQKCAVGKDVYSDLLFIRGLMVKAFCHGLLLGMKHESITSNHRQKDSQWNGTNQLWGYTYCRESNGHCFYWDPEGVILIDMCHMVTPLTRVCTLKLSEPCRVISGEFNFIHLVIPGECSMNHTIIINT